ncbi:MAG: PEGA domain-containing protein [Myxococcales bacterium]|nr:PEGA domain-containing protein [Myxococcales bacterium]
MRRSSDPDIRDDRLLAALTEEPVLGSIPPDAVVPAGSGLEEPPVVIVAAPAAESSPEGAGDASSAANAEAGKQGPDDRPEEPAAPSERPPAVAAASAAPSVIAPPVIAPVEEPPLAPSAETGDMAQAVAPSMSGDAMRPVAPMVTGDADTASAPSADAEPKDPRGARRFWGPLLVVGVLAAAITAFLRMPAGEDEPSPSPPATASSGRASGSAAPERPVGSSPTAAPAMTGTTPVATNARTAAPAGAQTVDGPPPGVEIPQGLGWLEIRTPSGASVRVDSKDAGAGPLVSIPAQPGYHEVRVRSAGHDATQVIEVRRGKTTRVTAPPAP